MGHGLGPDMCRSKKHTGYFLKIVSFLGWVVDDLIVIVDNQNSDADRGHHRGAKFNDVASLKGMF